MVTKMIPLWAFCLLAGLLGAAPTAGLAGETSTPEGKSVVITLTEALERTLARSARLTMAAGELRAAETEVKRAGRYANPELTLSLENLAGDGAYRGTDAAELTIELGQQVELGGKPRLRREAAELGRQLAANSERLIRADVLAETHRRFVTLLAAQDGLTLAREQAVVAERACAAAEERIQAGKAPAIERMRLEGQVSLARLAVTRAESDLQSAHLALAASWGDDQADFARAAGDLALLPPSPDSVSVEGVLERSSAMIEQRIATELVGKEVEQAKAARIPDPTFTVGWRQFRENNEQAWLIGVSVPLPLFDQGPEALAAAGSRYQAAKARETATHLETRLALKTAVQKLSGAKAAAEIYADRIVPAAIEGYATAEIGYRAGKFPLLELLDAQRALFEARQQELAARADCHLAAIELHRLIQTP